MRLAKTYTKRLTTTLLTPFLLTHQVRFALEEDTKHRRWIPHEAQQLLRLNACIGLDATERPFELPIAEEEEQEIHELLEKTFPEQSKYIGVHLSGKWLDEGWSGADLVKLFEVILQRHPEYRLLITCGPADKLALKELLANLPDSQQQIVTNESIRLILNGRAILADDLTFQYWIALLAQSQLIITPDTGALHLASALHKPIIAIYSPIKFHQNSHQWCPLKVANRILVFASYEVLSPLILAALPELLPEENSATNSIN